MPSMNSKSFRTTRNNVALSLILASHTCVYISAKFCSWGSVLWMGTPETEHFTPNTKKSTPKVENFTPNHKNFTSNTFFVTKPEEFYTKLEIFYTKLMAFLGFRSND